MMVGLKNSRQRQRAQFLTAMLLFLAVMIVPVAIASPEFDSMKITAPEKRVQAPQFSLKTLDKELLNLSDYKGQVVVLNFWATYCIPCRIEMPSLEKLSQRYDGKDLSVVAISLDEDKERAIRKLVEKLELSFPIAIEGQEAGDDYEVSVLPVTYLIGKNGELLGRAVGDRDWADEEAIQLMEALLEN